MPANTPQFLGTNFSSLYSVLMRPQIMTGLLRTHLIQHFQEGSIENDALKSLIWRPSDRTSILIESSNRWKPKTTGKYPAIIVRRNSCSNQREGINDKLQGSIPEQSGDEFYATFWAGSHTLFCLAREGAQAELLAAEVQRELTEFGPLILDKMMLQRFQVLDMGAVSEIEEAEEISAVPLTVGYIYEEGWRVSQQAPRWTKLSLKTLLDLE